MKQTFGRQKTLIFPPHQPIYSFLAAAAALTCAGLGAWQCLHYGTTPLQNHYMRSYVRADVGSKFNQKSKFNLLWLGVKGSPLRYATDADLVPGQTPVVGQAGKLIATLPFKVAPALAGKYRLIVSPNQYPDASMYKWFQANIYDGQTPQSFLTKAGYEGLGSFLVFMIFAAPADKKRLLLLKYGRRLKGPELVTPKQFTKAVSGNGLGFYDRTTKTTLRIPRANEAQHQLWMGDTGAGKSSGITSVLQQVAAREHTAVVLDMAGEFVQKFFNKSRGDVILNPYDLRCPYWGPVEELRASGDAYALADALYQPGDQADANKFFYTTPTEILARMITDDSRPTPKMIVEWLSNPKMIDELLYGDPSAIYVDPKAGPQRIGVLSSLNAIAKAFALIPTLEQADKQVWSANAWSRECKGWIFITSTPEQRKTLKPLQSLWLDLLINRVMLQPAAQTQADGSPSPKKTPVWFVMDELPALQHLPGFHAAMAEGRKSGNTMVLGIQGYAQLEKLYGKLAPVLASQPILSFYGRTREPEAAKWISNSIGELEIEMVKETVRDGKPTSRSFAMERKQEPLVIPSEVSGMKDLNFLMKFGNYVVPLTLPYVDMPKTTPSFIPWPDRPIFHTRNVRPEPLPAAKQVETEPKTLTEPQPTGARGVEE